MELNEFLTGMILPLQLYSVMAVAWMFIECFACGFVRERAMNSSIVISGIMWPFEVLYLLGLLTRVAIEFLEERL